MKCLVTALASMLALQPKVKGVTLEKSLRLYRAEQSYVRSVPASSIFCNKLLLDIANFRPTTLKQLQNMRGIGAHRCKSYGADIVKIVNLNCKNRAKAKATKPKATDKGPAKAKTKRGKRKAAKTAAKIKKQSPTKLPAPRPRPKPRPRPRPRPMCAPHAEVETEAAAADDADASSQAVYILELEQGRVYVGKSKDIGRRIAQHMAGSGSAYTRYYKPTGVLLPRLGNVSGSGDAAERDETLRYMFLRGIEYVRGWKFSQIDLPPEDVEEAEANIRELYDLCRRCGFKGHFMNQCKFILDRHGRPCMDT